MLDFSTQDVAPVAAPVQGRAFVAGTYWWNHPTLRALFPSPDGPPVFCRSYEVAIERATATNGRVIAWSSGLEPDHVALCRQRNVDLWRIEDGFIRSVGLGAGFVTAASLAIDGRGIHYDARSPSDLEHLLETADVDAEEAEIGARIGRRIVASRLSKYNLATRSNRLELPAGRYRVLVPGQAADDASILMSMAQGIDVTCPETVNVQLLEAVRARHPKAYLVYKPHPDVQSGLRKGHLSPRLARQYADLVVDNIDIVELINACDAVETISSLTGFEALLRGKHVTTHGLPFYAGWGLTETLVATPRRSRRRSLDELIFLALAVYTRHVHPLTHVPCSAEDLIAALSDMRHDRVHRWRSAVLQRVAWTFECMKF
jgi:capsular polysaccharide export protein